MASPLYNIPGASQPSHAPSPLTGTAGAAGAAGGTVGALLGGVITEELSWRWIFFVNVPIGITAILVARLALGESRVKRRIRLDIPGA